MEACRRLGHQFVECVLFDGTEIDARMWEIAENLHRADLTAQERAEQRKKQGTNPACAHAQPERLKGGSHTPMGVTR
jgi:hypothetical protein